MKIINKFDGTEHAFLSNFFKCKVEYEGIIYPTTEHAYQAAKTHDVSERLRIASQPSPGKAKKMGREITLRNEWDEIKDQVMLDICYKKFQQPMFETLLLKTGDAELIEGNTWHDNYWGICNCGKCPLHKQQPGGPKNMLGKTIMKIRADLFLRKIIRDEIDNEIK